MLKILKYASLFLITAYTIVCLFMYFLQERMMFFPDKLEQSFVHKLNNCKEDFEEVFIKSGDAQLNALHFKVPSPKGVILYYHGNASSLLSWSEAACDFTKHGFDVFMIDYKGYGKSSGTINSEYSLLEDADAAYNYLIEKGYEVKDILPYGISLGSGLATYIASKHEVKTLFLEAPYYNFRQLASDKISFLPSFLIAYRLPINEWIKDVKAKVFIFHGTDDEVIPYNNSKLLHQENPDKSKLTTIFRFGHNDLPKSSSYHKELYNVLVLDYY